MATVGTTYQTYQGKGIREDLTDVIYDITPTDTPFFNNAGRSTVKNTLHEWQTDALASVDTANKQIEGDDISAFPAANPSVRVGNYTQISRKVVIVADTLDAVDKAGRNAELAYQLSKLGKELKRDMEAIACENIAGAAGNASTARATATLGAWVKTNVDKHATGGNPTYSSGVPGAARTDGTQRALTEAMSKNVCQLVWASGGTLKMVMAGPVNKQNISKFAGVATKTFDWTKIGPMAVIGAVDILVTDFGQLQVVANRFQRERDVWYLDPEMVNIGYLRPFQQKALAKTGDAEKRMMLAEWCLIVKNEKGFGLIADLDSVVQ